MRTTTGLLALAVLSSAASAQLTQEWASRYTSIGNVAEDPRSVAVDSQGNVIVAGIGRIVGGTTNDGIIVKYSAAGDELWVRNVNGAANGSDVALSVALDASDNIYVGGYVLNSGTAIASRDAYAVKFLPDGTQAWLQTYDHAGREEQPGFIKVTPDGQSVYVGGYTKLSSGAFDWDYLLVKWDGAGNFQWARTYTGPAGPGQSDQSDSGFLDAAGRVYMTGSSANTSTSFDVDVAVVGWDADGTQFYEARFNGPVSGSDRGNAVTVDANGVYVAATVNTTASPSNPDMALLKFDMDGALTWARTYDPAGLSDAGLSVISTPSGVFVGGTTRETTDADMTVRKYAHNGDLLWNATWDRTAVGGTDSFRTMTLMGDMLAMLGTSNNVVGGTFGVREDIATVIVDAASGAIAGATLFDGPALRGDTAWDITTDPARNRFVVSGSSNGGTTGGTGNDFITIAYSTAPACGTADFDGDGDVGTDADIEAFFACLAGNCCATCFSGGADFNGDGDTGTDADIESFFRVLAGGEC